MKRGWLGWSWMRALIRENRELKKQIESLEARLEVDELTGLLNGSSLRKNLQNEIQAIKKRGGEPALLFLDVDHFKRVNESHGHAVGSHLLRKVGWIIQGCIRQGDKAYRFGGDEFVVIVQSAAGARILAERIRSAVDTHGFRVKGLQGLCDLKLSVSIGVRAMNEGDTTQQLLDEADRAMFEAKRRSRNTVVESSSSHVA